MWHQVDLLRVWHEYAKFKIRQLRNFSARMESGLVREREAEWARLSRITAGLPHDAAETFSEGYWELHDVVPQVFRRAIFLAAHAIFERTLQSLCWTAAREFGLAPRSGPMPEEFLQVDHPQSFLKKRFCVHIGPLPDWDVITHLRHLRNHVAHNDARLPNQKKVEATRGFVRKHSQLVSVDGNGDLKFEEGFVPFVLEQYEKFCDQIDGLLGKSRNVRRGTS
jgi:hypothetical protein